MMEIVMKIADHAWKDLMKEKMKAEFDKKIGDRMNKVVAATVDASVAKHMHKKEGHQKHMENKKNIEQAFMA